MYFFTVLSKLSNLLNIKDTPFCPKTRTFGSVPFGQICFPYLLQPQPQLQNNIKNISIKNNMLLSPHPQPPNKLPKNPPLLQQQSLFSSCIIITSFPRQILFFPLSFSIDYASSSFFVTVNITFFNWLLDNS